MGVAEKANQDVLFSGAFTAISQLLEEFTGANMNLKELRLDRMRMLIKSLPNELSVVLIVDKSTTFFKQSLNLFSNKIQDLLKDEKILLGSIEKFIPEITKLTTELFGDIFDKI